MQTAYKYFLPCGKNLDRIELHGRYQFKIYYAGVVRKYKTLFFKSTGCCGEKGIYNSEQKLLNKHVPTMQR